MNEIIIRIAPILAIFALGAVLRGFKICSRHDGDMLLKLVFYLGIPGLVLPLFAKVAISEKLAQLILVAPLITLTTYVAALHAGRRLITERKKLGTFIVGSITINTLFVLPFILAAYGPDGFTDAMMIDLGNGMIIFSFNYWIACRYGEERSGTAGIVRKFLSSPPLWAIIGGLLLNFTGISLAPAVEEVCKRLGEMTVPMTMLALGVYFTPRLAEPRLIFTALFLRMICGAAAAWSLGRLLGLDPLGQRVITLAGAAPAGFNTLTYSSICKLDTDLAASIVSTTIVAGVIGLPFLILLLNGVV